MDGFITREEFDRKVEDFSETNPVMRSLRAAGKTWTDLPQHLQKDLFARLGYEPVTLFRKR